MENLVIENNSHAQADLCKKFYDTVLNLDECLKSIICQKGLKLVLADKLSEVIQPDELDSCYDYKPDNRDKVTRGLTSGMVMMLAFFTDVVKTENLPAIIYHEIGHVIDRFESWDYPSFSNTQEFIEAYKKDIAQHWEELQNDKRFRLIHYVQNSTPENFSQSAASEVFAQCFASINGYLDDEPIIEQYFENSKNCAETIYKNFLQTYKEKNML